MTACFFSNNTPVQPTSSIDQAKQAGSHQDFSIHLVIPQNTTAATQPIAIMSNDASSSSDVLTPQYTPEQISAFNKQLDGKTPQEILTWAIDNLDGLFQTTAFGL